MTTPIEGTATRPKITLVNGQIQHNGKPCMVVLGRDWLSIGCSDITPEAAKHVLRAWEERFERTVVLQSGE